MVHNIHWPSKGIVRDLVDGIEHYVRKFNTDIYLIFDRFKGGSIKSDTRKARVVAFRRSHQLSLERRSYPQKIWLSSSST